MHIFKKQKGPERHLLNLGMPEDMFTPRKGTLAFLKQTAWHAFVLCLKLCMQCSLYSIPHWAAGFGPLPASPHPCDHDISDHIEGAS